MTIKSMHLLLKHQLDNIHSMIERYLQKKDDAMNKISYLRGLQLYLVTLRKTYEELEDVYFTYALKPQIQLTQPIVISCVYCMHKMITEKKESQSLLL